MTGDKNEGSYPELTKPLPYLTKKYQIYMKPSRTRQKYNCSGPSAFKSLTKNYCITISIQKINSINKFNLKIQKNLGKIKYSADSHELKDHGHI